MDERLTRRHPSLCRYNAGRGVVTRHTTDVCRVGAGSGISLMRGNKVQHSKRFGI